MTLKFDWWPQKIIGHLFYITLSFVHHLKPLGEFELQLLSENTQFGSKSAIFSPCDLEIQWMTLKNNRDPLLCYIKLCASFQSHRWIQTKVTVRKHSIRVKIGDLLSRVTLKFDGWPWKNNRAPLLCCFKFYASFHNHRWIQTKATVRKRSIRVKIDDFLSSMTLKFDEWPWKTTGHLFYATSGFMHHFVAIGEFKLELQSGNAQFFCQNRRFLEQCDLEIWWMTLKNNRAPLLSTIKLYASFYHHMWIQTGVTVRKRLSWVMTSVTLTFDLDLLHGHHFCHW